MPKTIIEKSNFVEVIKKDLDPDYLEGCLASLDRLEKAIVKVLYVEKIAMSVIEIRNDFIMDVGRQIVLAYKVQTSKKKKVRIVPYPNFYLSIMLSEASIEDAFKELNEFCSKTDRKKYELVAGYNKIFSKYRVVETPSFRTIETALNNLISIGLIIKREVVGTKHKALYSLNPIFYKYLKKVKEFN